MKSFYVPVLLVLVLSINGGQAVNVFPDYFLNLWKFYRIEDAPPGQLLAAQAPPLQTSVNSGTSGGIGTPPPMDSKAAAPVPAPDGPSSPGPSAPPLPTDPLAPPLPSADPPSIPPEAQQTPPPPPTVPSPPVEETADECWERIYKVGECDVGIYGAYFDGFFEGLGCECCKAVADLPPDCTNGSYNMFTAYLIDSPVLYNPAFPKQLRDYCARRP